MLLCFCTVLRALCGSGEEAVARWTIVLKGSAQGQRGNSVEMHNDDGRGGKVMHILEGVRGAGHLCQRDGKNITYPPE